MKRSFIMFLILILLLTGCVEHPASSGTDKDTDGNAAVSQTVDSKMPDPPEGANRYDFPGEDTYYRRPIVFDYEGIQTEFEEYYKWVEDHWEKLPMFLYEQTITVPHLAQPDVRLSLWVVQDGSRLIRAKDRNGEWNLQAYTRGSWLYLSSFYYYILWDEETLQFVDVFKDLDLSMNERGYFLYDITPDLTKAFFRDGKTLPVYFADLAAGKVYDLREIAGEDLQVVMMTDRGVIAVGGLQEVPGLTTAEYAVFNSYYTETSVRKEVLDGYEFLFWQIGTEHRFPTEETIRFNRQESPYGGPGYSTQVIVDNYLGETELDLAFAPENIG